MRESDNYWWVSIFFFPSGRIKKGKSHSTASKEVDDSAATIECSEDAVKSGAGFAAILNHDINDKRDTLYLH